jgi:hypothetical protein
MVQFDENELPDAIVNVEMVRAANGILRQLYKMKVDTIRLDGPDVKPDPGMTRLYLQSHLRRMLMFLEGGVAEYRAFRPLVAVSAARSVYESVASIHDFCTKFNALIDQSDFTDADQFLQNNTLASRVVEFLEEDRSNEAKNILTKIANLEKQAKGFQESYNKMSEYAHPNALGSVVHYLNVNEDVATFDDRGNMPTRPLTYLILASVHSAWVMGGMLEVEKRLKALEG